MKIDLIFEIINSIDEFILSTDFIAKLSRNNFTFSILSEGNDEVSYSRSIQFTVNNLTVLDGEIQLLKTKIKQDMLEELLNSKQPIGRYIALNPESKITKKVLSKALCETKFKIYSEFYYDATILCGHCKEIFNLKNISKFYPIK